MNLPSFAESLNDLGDGLEVANHLVNLIVGHAQEKIGIIETLKKTPDYHANFCVERILLIAKGKMALKDEREDDCYLKFDEEPVSIKLFFGEQRDCVPVVASDFLQE